MDAVCAALLLTDPRRGRPLVVVFSDGVDHGSWLTPEDALAAAKAEDVVIDYVEAEGALTFLQPIAEATGGRGWPAKSWDRLARAFVDALEEFRSRYRLRYEPSGVARPGWHALSVRLARASAGRSARGRVTSCREAAMRAEARATIAALVAAVVASRWRAAVEAGDGYRRLVARYREGDRQAARDLAVTRASCCRQRRVPCGPGAEAARPRPS